MKMEFVWRRLSFIASATSSVASVQTATTRSLRSSSVIRPRSYSRSTLATSSSYRARIASFEGGITMSFFETVMPARVAKRNARDLIVSSTDATT